MTKAFVSKVNIKDSTVTLKLTAGLRTRYESILGPQYVGEEGQVHGYAVLDRNEAKMELISGVYRKEVEFEPLKDAEGKELFFTVFDAATQQPKQFPYVTITKIV
jgi:hypothetical protein